MRNGPEDAVHLNEPLMEECKMIQSCDTRKAQGKWKEEEEEEPIRTKGRKRKQIKYLLKTFQS